MPIPSTNPLIGRTSLRGVAKDRLRTAIFDGTLQPGEHLTDDELQSWLGMSRTPIREALNDLARLGLVEMVPQKFTRVALPDPSKRSEVQQTVGVMFGGIVRVTVPTLTPAQQQQLLETLDALIDEIPNQDEATFMPAAEVFAQQITDMCPVELLVGAIAEILDSLTFQMRATAAVSEVRWELIDEGYHRLRDAIAALDGHEARLAVEHAFRLSDIEHPPTS